MFENEQADRPVGVAAVENGIITKIEASDAATEDYKGEILNKLLGSITYDADVCNSNLSIQIPATETSRWPRFLERYGFRRTHPGIYKRLAGSVRPPSVVY